MFHWHSEVVAFVVPSHTRILLLFYRPLFVCLFASFSLVIVLYIPWTSGAGTAYPSGAPEFTPVLSGVRVTRSLVLYVCFVDRCLFFVFFFLAIVFSVLLRYTILITPLLSSNSSYDFLFLYYYDDFHHKSDSFIMFI